MTVSAGSDTIAAPIMLADNANFNTAAGSRLTISGSISGSYPVSVGGSGTLVLSAANPYTGPLAVTGGTLQLNNAAAVQNSTLVVVAPNSLAFGTGIGTFTLGGLSGQGVGGITLADTGGNAVSLTVGGNNQSTTYSGGLSGGSTITKVGSGETTLSGSGVAGYWGNVTVSAGTLQVMDAVSITSTNGGPCFSAGLAAPANTLTTSAGGVLELYVDANTGWTSDNWDNGGLGNYGGTTITGNGVFRKTGDGTLSMAGGTLGAGSVTFAMSGGTIDIEGGNLRNGGNAVVYWTNNKASLTIGSGGTLEVWGGQPITIDALNGAGVMDSVYGGPVAFTIGVNNGSGTWAGTITERYLNVVSSMTKVGTGTQVFATANDYTGPTTVNGGVLQLANPNALQWSPTIVNVAGGLGFGSGVGAVNVASLAGGGNVTLTDAGGGAVTLNVGANNASTTYGGALSGLGGLAKAGTGAMTLTATHHSYSGATAITGGTLALAAGSYTLGTTSTITVSNSSFETPSIPGGYQYNPTGASWTFANNSGVTAQGSGFGTNGTPPDGNQCAFLQDAGNNGVISEVINFSAAGSYTLNFYGNNRDAGNPFLVEVDGVSEGSFHPTGGWQALTSNIFAVSAGTHTIAFVGEGTGNDVTSFIDAVSINLPGTYVANTNMLPATTSLSLSAGAALDLGGNNQQVASLADYAAGSGGTVVNSNTSYASTLTLSTTGGATTFSGVLAGGSGFGAINLVMSGSGTEVLAGSNTYTGSTTINGGNLAVNGSLSSSGSVTVNSPGTLSGAGTVGSVAVNAHGTVAPGFSLGGGTLTAGSLSLSPSSVLSYTLTTSTASSGNSQLDVTGGLTLSTGLTVSITPASWTSATSGTYVLATYGSLANNSSSFSGWTVANNPLLGRHTYGFSVGSGSLDLSVGTGATISGTWSGSGGGSWATAGNWQGGNIPAYAGDTAAFGSSIGSTTATVTLDGARGLSGLTLSTTGGGSYTLSRTSGDTASALMLANGGGTVTVSVSGGSQTIAVPVDAVRQRERERRRRRKSDGLRGRRRRRGGQVA